jgi:hypothetical protein
VTVHTQAAPRKALAVSYRPPVAIKVAAILVIVALAALSAFAMFSGPTPIRAPTLQGTPTPAHPVAPGEEPEGGGDR